MGETRIEIFVLVNLILILYLCTVSSLMHVALGGIIQSSLVSMLSRKVYIVLFGVPELGSILVNHVIVS